MSKIIFSYPGISVILGMCRHFYFMEVGKGNKNTHPLLNLKLHGLYLHLSERDTYLTPLLPGSSFFLIYVYLRYNVTHSAFRGYS